MSQINDLNLLLELGGENYKDLSSDPPKKDKPLSKEEEKLDHELVDSILVEAPEVKHIGIKNKRNIRLRTKRKVHPKVTMPEELYRDIKKQAKIEDVEVNTLLVSCLEEGFVRLYQSHLLD